MRLLLDTHVVLWWLTDDPALSDELKERITHDPDICVSAATIWEVAIKQALGKLGGPVGLADYLTKGGFIDLPIGLDHAVVAGRLPPIHRDPFDRMLVAQAQCEDLTLVTRDSWCRQYEVSVLVA
ncbi:type II toxin-antitoxin system VapC family toxin [Nocardia sp. NPDC049149]|uniref:type II toxin-antitoxin system VapC family toxin n=1 Tax=Nocardia sp. NPDC049149 TaxID=3364315 RepID=UPI00371A12BF